MQTFHTPPGKAGSDQLGGMEASVRGDIRAMYQAGVERSLLDFDARLNRDASIRMEVRRRACDARITSSAGRAVEGALKLVHAYGTDRIMAREFPSVDAKQMREDKKSHKLSRLRQTILDDMEGRDMESALEDAYQQALNLGLRDVWADGEHLQTVYISLADVPLRELATGGMRDGEEYTTDHSPSALSLVFGRFDRQGKESAFSKLPIDTFDQFLVKADHVYYEEDTGSGKRRPMHWEAYGTRDHERSRPYVVAGVEFFARLVEKLVFLSKQHWVSDKGRLVRQFERGNYNLLQRMTEDAKRRFSGNVVFPPMIPGEERVRGVQAPNVKAYVERGYQCLRQKQDLVTKRLGDAKA